MLKKKATLHLLLLDPSQNDAELIVSQLRNAGYATRAHRVTSEEDLEESLQQQNWDLFIARESDGELGFEACLSEIKRLDLDIPFILTTEESDEDLWLKAVQAGARDALQRKAEERLMLVARREYEGLEDRRRKHLLESHLREAEKRCQTLLESSRDAIAYIGEGMHIFANQSYLELLGYEDNDEMMCVPVVDIIASKDQDSFKDALKQFQGGENQEASLPVTVNHADGSELEVVVSLHSATYDGESCIQLIIRPQVDQELEEKLKRFSSEDLLTGLYNKNHFVEALENAREQVLGGKVRGILFFIELDDFGSVRDEYTITGSDTLLAETANLLREKAREDDTIARLGDDVFAVLSMDLDDQSAVNMAESWRQGIENHLFDLGDRTVQLTASIGVVRMTDNAPPVQDLIERGHKASSHVASLPGHDKGNGVYLYNALDFESGGSLEDQDALLQQALDDNRFKLLFQPIISLRGESEEHYETFLRMINNEGKEILPTDFLPVDERSNLALKLDRWVTLQNVKSLSAHRSRGHDTRLIVNLSYHTILDTDFHDWLGKALGAAKLPGDSLIFQLAEETAIQHLKQAKSFSESIRDLGCKISLSRFGGAINPFNTLKHVDADYIKLDGSFIDEIQKSEEAREQLKEIVDQLREQNRKSIMPLVESAAILATLWQAGVDYIQGYYLQAPTAEMNYDFSEND